MSNQTKFSTEVRNRAVRIVQEQLGGHPSLWAAAESIGPKFGCAPSTLVDWVKRAQIDSGVRPGLTTEERERVKALEREVKELRRANEIPEDGECFFRPGGARPPTEEVNAYIDEHRALYGVEPICKVLQVAPSSYRRHAARQRFPALHGRTAHGPPGH